MSFAPSPRNRAVPIGALLLLFTLVKHGRLVDLAVSDLFRDLLSVLRLRAGDATFVFEAAGLSDDETPVPISRAAVAAAQRRLVQRFGGPRFSWQRLRVTCGTYLANAPGIFGAASAYREAKQLGHSVTVAEKHYLGVVHVVASARTLEAAMGIEKALRSALGLGDSAATRAAGTK